LLAVRFLATRLLVTHGVGPKTPKAQARRLRLWFPSEFFSLYPYFINFTQANRKIWRLYICLAC
jgi:hypothetical protein